MAVIRPHVLGALLHQPAGYFTSIEITRFTLSGQSDSCGLTWVIISGNARANKDKANRKLCGTLPSGETISFENRVTIDYNNYQDYEASFTLVYNAVPFTAAQLSASWIKENTMTLLEAKEHLPFLIPALYLFDETLLDENLQIGYQFRTQYLLKLSEDLLRNSTQRLSLADYSHHVTALLAMCKNPRSFRGINLVDHMRQLANAEPNYFKPFDILTLCSAGEKMTSSDIRRLTAILNTEDTHGFMLGIKATAVIALTCVKRQIENQVSADDATELEITVDDTLQESVDALKLHQKRDGGFGSLQTTVLAYQALSAASAYGWDSTSALNFINRRNHTDGSFGNLDDLYAVLPTLKGRTFLDINASNCGDFLENGVPALQEVKDKMATFISLTYHLWIGDEVDVKHTITLRFANGSSFMDVMRLAAEKDMKYKLKWTFVKEVIYVYEISDIINNPTSGKYWRLYTFTEDEQAVLYTQGLENYVPRDGDTAIMWYRTVELSV